MPIYRYRCIQCDQQWDKFNKVDDRNDVQCPNNCDAEVKIVPGKFSVAYKCEGFAHQELAMEKQQQLVQECTEEGFLSTTEMEEGVAQGIERAQKLGIDPAKIVGKDTLTEGVGSLEDAVENNMAG